MGETGRGREGQGRRKRSGGEGMGGKRGRNGPTLFGSSLRPCYEHKRKH